MLVAQPIRGLCIKKSITVSVWPTQDKLTKNILNTKIILFTIIIKNIQKKIMKRSVVFF